MGLAGGVLTRIDCNTCAGFASWGGGCEMERLMKMMDRILGSGLLLMGLAGVLRGAPAEVVVDAGKPGHRVSPLLWGVFFEDINLSADGGLYGELVRNRSFEEGNELPHWRVVSGGGMEVEAAVTCEELYAENPLFTRNKHVLRLVAKGSGGAAGVANEGYWGVPVREGAAYRLGFAVRVAGGGEMPMKVSLEGKDGRVHAEGRVLVRGDGWAVQRVELKSAATDSRARLVLRMEAPGQVWLDMVSLFPAATWKGRENGLRPDLAEMLVGLKPAFLRFPGGCWVEGDTMREAYRWKETVGPLHERRTQWNIWGYWATHGLGYHEYLQLCEDLKAEPLFCINVGMSHRENVPMERMDEYVQDALDAIEYANGPVTSRWGAMRAANGHPEPFNMKYIEIGNENGGPAYNERWPLFHKAIKARYPEMVLIANEWAGGHPKHPAPEIVDEHYYNNPEFFMRKAELYDGYDRKGPRIFVGEYAVTQGTGKGSLRGAIGEAAFMTGLERNSDVVAMAAYAPLFVHVNHRRWNPDLINFDNTRVYGLPSYYVQKMFAENRGDVVLPVTVKAEATPVVETSGAIGVGTWMTQAEFKDLKVERGGEVIHRSDFSRGTEGWRFLGDGKWKVVDGALRQEGDEPNVRAVFGDAGWSGYTYSLKARKLGGAEGFLVMFNVKSDDGKSWWNLGGWSNARHGLEIGGGESGVVGGKIETGRWYDIRVETAGGRVKCYLDGELVHDVVPGVVPSLFASATVDEAAGEVIVKVVNGAHEARDVEVRIEGARVAEGPAALAQVLTSAGAMDENSLDEPAKVVPRPVPVRVEQGRMQQRMPGNAFSVVRLKMVR